MRILNRSVLALLLAAMLFYAADYIIWRIRMTRGMGTESFSVNRMSVAPLKGGKEEYYFDGTDTATCTMSLLPPFSADGWGTPCWWLRRHRQIVTQY